MTGGLNDGTILLTDLLSIHGAVESDGDVANDKGIEKDRGVKRDEGGEGEKIITSDWLLIIDTFSDSNWLNANE